MTGADDPSTAARSSQPLLGLGRVHHRRLRPKPHAFDYASCFLLLPMRSLAASPSTMLARNRFAPIAFFDRDHGDGGEDALAWLDALLVARGIDGATGEAWLQTSPRMLGYAFKPVSFWYCHRADGSLRAVVVEVNNTFGERHCYVLDAPAWDREIPCEKAFHVSPFCRVEGGYRFRFQLDLDRGTVSTRVDHDDAAGPVLETAVGGRLAPATRANLRGAFWRHPAMSFGVIAHIHWQALRLAIKGVPLARNRTPLAQDSTPLPRRRPPGRAADAAMDTRATTA